MRRFSNLLICLAFAVRSLVPVGFMLTVSPYHGGLPEVVICTGHGPLSLTLDKTGAPLPARAPVSGQDVCPYAPVAAVAASSDAPHLLVGTVHYASLSYRITSERFHATPKAGAHFARGPPAVLI